MVMRVAGLISGTSADGIDVAVAELRLDGTEIVLTPLGALSRAYPEDLRADLLAALPPGPATAELLTRLDTRVGQAFADAVQQALDRFGPADLIGSLGQTVFHWVEDGQARGTLQLGQPAWIAERTGVPVVSDLRARDVAAGGHGAPLAATLDRLWLRELAESGGRPAVALNIGGIANITVVRPDGSAIAYDTGPGNALLDLAAYRATGRHCDVDGALAAQGRVREDLLHRLLTEPYYAAERPKSTGKELFHGRYLDGLTAGPQDLLATLTELTARTVADACARHGGGTVVVSGGGVENLAAHARARREPARHPAGDQRRTRASPRRERGVPGRPARVGTACRPTCPARPAPAGHGFSAASPWGPSRWSSPRGTPVPSPACG
jgi:anhydro-N-acetylmuramic acid kinase